MTTADDAGPGLGLSHGRADFWARTVHWWDVAFYAMVAIAALTLVLEADGGTQRIPALAVLAGLVVAYLLLGRRAARTGEPGMALAYLVLLVVAVGAVVHLEPVGSVLLFIAYSQGWYLSWTRVMGVLVSVALTAAVLVGLVLRPDVGVEGLGDTATSLALSLVFSVLLGLWITTVAEQGEIRAQLLADLQAAQSELAATHHATGVLAERERMAREIHDTLAQGFTSVVVLSQAAAGDLRGGRTEQALERLDMVERTARDNLAEARALVAALAPVDLTDSTLGEALQRLADRFSDETGLAVEVEVDARPTATPGRDGEVVLLRAAQEALTNVRRHAGAGRVRVLLADDDAGTLLEVADDGAGIAPGAVEGYGLRGMRARVADEGGHLDIGPGEDGGTILRVTLPARPADGERGARCGERGAP